MESASLQSRMSSNVYTVVWRVRIPSYEDLIAQNQLEDANEEKEDGRCLRPRSIVLRPSEPPRASVASCCQQESMGVLWSSRVGGLTGSAPVKAARDASLSGSLSFLAAWGWELAPDKERKGGRRGQSDYTAQI